jgi:predicted ATPase/DNA-binding CsgD family transcriptional regulator
VPTGPSPPTPATALLGRAPELARVVDLVTTPGARLVTITGPPGVGKTRLALAAAAALSDHFAGATAWVDLAPVRDSRLVAAEIARTLGVRRSAAETPLIRLAAAVAGRDLLIVLDNCEHLLDAVPDVGSLLASSPRLRLLATSRERLRLAAEHEVALPPLPMPATHASDDLPALRANPSIALLLARAPAHVALTARTAQSLVDICIRLDGLPLALELAAARLRVFTPGELAFRLDHRMTLLTGAARDTPARHRDLRAAIAWSHDLLPDAERTLFRRLSVFNSDWTARAAAAVCGDAGTLDAIESLLDKSLIVRAAGEDGEARFAMLTSLREFATEQLEQHGEEADTVARHRRYFVEAARRWETSIGTEDESTQWSSLEPVRADVLAAFFASQAADDVEGTLWLAAALGWYWYIHGSLADAAALPTVVSAAACDPRSSSDARAAALVAAGVVALGVGDLDDAARYLDLAIELCTAAGDRRRLAVINAFLGHVARGRGQFADAAGRYGAARTIFEALGNPRGTAWAMHDLGLLASEQGDPDEAETLLRDALRLFRGLDYDWAIAVTAGALATALLRAGLVDEPSHLLGEALERHDGVGDRRGVAQCLEGLAEVASMRGSAATAARLLGAAAAQRLAVAARPTDAEQGRLDRLGVAVLAALGRPAADHEEHAGRTMPAVEAIALAGEVAGDAAGSADPVSLTPRQLEVAALVAGSRTNRQIARALGISEKTTEIHVHNIMARLQSPSRAGIAAWAASHGLGPPR